VDRTATVRFSLDRQHLSNVIYEQDYIRRANAIYALGDGTGAARAVDLVTDAADIANSLRREAALDVRDGTTTELRQQAALTHMADRILEAQRATVPLAGDSLEDYRQKWDVGDDVTVAIPRIGAEITRRIEAVTVTLSEERYEAIDLQLGKSPLGIQALVGKLQRGLDKVAFA
jgi:prophage tail gpP-like protein